MSLPVVELRPISLTKHDGWTILKVARTRMPEGMKLDLSFCRSFLKNIESSPGIASAIGRSVSDVGHNYCRDTKPAISDA